MKKFEFKSQICTTREQSERLLALGLKKETADCALFLNGNNEFEQLSNFGDWERYADMFPAWSLHRLIEMSLNLSYGVAYCYTAGSNMNVTYDEVIDMIEWAISKECFNKDYLEEKK